MACPKLVFVSVCGRSKSVGRGRFLATDLKVDLHRPTETDFFPTFSVKKTAEICQIFREIATKTDMDIEIA